METQTQKTKMKINFILFDVAFMGNQSVDEIVELLNKIQKDCYYIGLVGDVPEKIRVIEIQ